MAFFSIWWSTYCVVEHSIWIHQRKFFSLLFLRTVCALARSIHPAWVFVDFDMLVVAMPVAIIIANAGEILAHKLLDCSIKEHGWMLSKYVAFQLEHWCASEVKWNRYFCWFAWKRISFCFLNANLHRAWASLLNCFSHLFNEVFDLYFIFVIVWVCVCVCIVSQNQITIDGNTFFFSWFYK